MTDKDYFAIFLIKIFVCSYDFFFLRTEFVEKLKLSILLKKKKKTVTSMKN